MSKIWVELADIPAEGRVFSFADQGFWQESLRNCALSATIAAPLEAEVTVTPDERGALVRGALRGSVILPCDRCSEDCEQTLDEEFEAYEELPAEGGESAEESRVVEEDGVLRLDLGAVLWEQFILALPPKPLCREDCKGLCPVCGGNRNFQECDCAEGGNDPRLSVFRNLKIS
ncbi:YceD family protein [Desulfovibrio sp.]